MLSGVHGAGGIAQVSDKVNYAPKELAERWGVSQRSIYRLIRCGKLTTFRVGRQQRISSQVVELAEQSRLQNQIKG